MIKIDSCREDTGGGSGGDGSMGSSSCSISYETKSIDDQSSTSSTSHQTQEQQSEKKITNQYAINWYTLVDKSVEESLNFREILQLFNCAISQEQAWAVLYECLIKFRYILENNLELIKLNQNKIDINLIYFVKDGSILFDFDKLTPKSNINVASSSSISSTSSEKHTLEMKLLSSIAYLIFDALDFGNSYSNEPALHNSLENLLILMSGHYKEYNNNRVSEDDEGYEQEEEDMISIDKAIEICSNNVQESEYHYRAVCRGLYAQAYELKAFLAKIEHSKNTLQKSGQDTTHYCFEVLDKTDWAKLWMQVIHELRNGVKLRKVCETQELLLRRHIEYELTPFEILLDQIRARRYNLKKVSLNKSIRPEIKKDARDIILDFIRSRPPLKNSSRRSLKPKIVRSDEPVNLHEQLMLSIRNYSTPLRKISIEKNNQSSGDEQNKTEPNKHQKRLLKVDKKLLNNLNSSDDDDSDIDYDEIQNLSILHEEFNTSQLSQMFTRNTNLTGSLSYSSSNNNNISSSSNNSSNRKRRIKAPDSLKSPLAPWCEPTENWRAFVTQDILVDSPSSKQENAHTRNTPTRRHTMNLADFKSFSNLFSKKTTNSLKCKQVKKITTEDSFLSLTFEELCHIRSVLTKAELDYLLFDSQLFHDVSKGKVCFSCRKTKFHLFYWGCKCRICQQRVCKKCLRTAQLSNGKIAQVPLFKLCPNKFSETDSDSRNSNSSMSSQATNEDTDQILSSNDKLSKDETILVSDTAAYENTNEENTNDTQLFDVCVDCYQMINGIKVSAKNLDLQAPEPAPSESNQTIKCSNQTLITNKNTKPTKKLVSSEQESSSAVKVSDEITMLSLNHISSIHSNVSPYFNKVITSSHHSTPTLTTPVMKNNQNLTTLIMNEISSEFDLYNSEKEMVCRQNLSLDLQPVYSKTSS